MTAPATPRGGHPAFLTQVGPVAVSLRMGRLDDMPRCAACGRALCSHDDAAFKGAR